MITFILRDIKDDAKKGRFYIPKDILAMAQISKDVPRAMVENKNLYIARAVLAERAEKNFNNAERLLMHMSKRDIMPIRLIKNISRCQFDMMKKRGWEIVSPKPKINWLKSFVIVYQTMFK